MDIAALSVVMSQSKVQQSAGIAVMKMAMDASKQTGIQMTEMMKNAAVDTNLGSYLDEKEKLKQELEKELQWVKYRQKMLDIIEGKLMQMREIAEQAKEGNLGSEEIQSLNTRIKDLASQVRALDGESRRIEDQEMVE